MIEVKSAQSKSELQAAFDIRREVFVQEQEVDEKEEYDEYETSSNHLIAFFDNSPAGTCRYRNTEKGIKLERFAVLNQFRNNKIGESLVNKVLSEIDTTQQVYLHAQIQVVKFYEKYGFEALGEMFEEANIQHYKMILRNKS